MQILRHIQAHTHIQMPTPRSNVSILPSPICILSEQFVQGLMDTCLKNDHVDIQYKKMKKIISL